MELIAVYNDRIKYLSEYTILLMQTLTILRGLRIIRHKHCILPLRKNAWIQQKFAMAKWCIVILFVRITRQV